jgi:hypothetical protein
MRRLADFGVDSLITDFPGLATATLGNAEIGLPAGSGHRPEPLKKAG